MNRQITLVAFYDDKPEPLRDLLQELVGLLSDVLGGGFAPYSLQQIHATLMGLERTQVGGRLVNSSFHALRGETRTLDFEQVTSITRANLPFDLQIGGFAERRAFPFQSRGRHPYDRSFSIRDGRAITIAWPVDPRGETYPPSLDSLRRDLRRAGALHKYHHTDRDFDNDLYFVLGSLAPDVPGPTCRRAEACLRQELANRGPLRVGLDGGSVSMVAYRDPRLPLASSERIALGQSPAPDPVVGGSSQSDR